MSNKLTENKCQWQGCNRNLCRGNATGYCHSHWPMAGHPKRGHFSSTRTKCWNKNCRRVFRCPEEKDPRYALCPTCNKLAHDLQGLNRFAPAADWLR